MITLHHLNNSRSQRILWMLEEIGTDYHIERYQRDAVTSLAPPALKQVHALGKSPVLTDGDVTVAESGAIIQYLADRFPEVRLQPAQGQARIDYNYWLHFAEGTLMPPMVAKLVLDKVRTKAKPFPIKIIANLIVDKVMDAYFGPNIESAMGFVEQYLSEHEWFAGDSLSGADVQMSFPLEAVVAKGSKGALVNIKRFVHQIHQRPAYQRALEKGGEYDYA